MGERASANPSRKNSDETVKKRTPKENHKYHPSALKHLEAKRVIGIAAALGLNPLPKDVDPFHGCATFDGLVTCGEITKSISHLSVSGGNAYSVVRLISLKPMELGELVLNTESIERRRLRMLNSKQYTQ